MWHLRRVDDSLMFDTYAASFEDVWSRARPVQAE